MALGVIRRVTEAGAYSNLALTAALSRSSLDERDRRFAADLVYGTLRAKVRLDAALAAASTRSLRAVDRATLAALRLGAYQILEARVPAHAAVGETVALVDTRARGFANAVLRRLASEPAPRARGGSLEAIAARTGLVVWAVDELARLLPRDQVEMAAAALASRADGTLRVNRCRADPLTVRERLESAGVPATPGRHTDDAIHVRSVVPARLAGFAAGWFTVQDEASILVVLALGARAGERVLDACAGPGGKTGHLACLAGPTGGVVAGDAHPGRASLVSSTLHRLGLRGLVLAQDARRPALRASFDAILVDAPCSGLGAARRRPELLWRPQTRHLSALARLQVSILEGVASLVRPGGRVLYSVCTFPRAETDAVVRAFLTRRTDFEPLEVSGPDGERASHRLWPHLHGTDAMFYAGLRRVGTAADVRGRTALQV